MSRRNYRIIGWHEKLEALFKEMKEDGVSPIIFIYEGHGELRLIQDRPRDNLRILDIECWNSDGEDE